MIQIIRLSAQFIDTPVKLKLLLSDDKMALAIDS